MKFVLPGLPPSINHSHRRARSLKPETAKWIEVAGLIMLGQAREQEKLPPKSELTLDVKLYGKWETKNGAMRRVDLSNRIKILEDTVAKVCRFDDSCVSRITAEKVQCPDGEWTEVEVLEVTA